MEHHTANRLFKGSRRPTGGADVTVDGVPLNTCNNVINHSPDGFEWGYLGSGPSQLSLAIMIEVTGDTDAAKQLYQQFKTEVISSIQNDTWQMSERDIVKWLNAKGFPKD